MDLWTFVWVFLSLLLLVTLLESIHRRSKRKRAAIEHQILQEQLRSQPYAVYTIQGNAGSGHTQVFTHGNSHFMKADDLPPKYEDIIMPRNETTAARETVLTLDHPRPIGTNESAPATQPGLPLNTTGRENQQVPAALNNENTR